MGDVNIRDEDAWMGGLGDRFFLRGDLCSSSTNRSGWQTSEAELRLLGAVRHVLSVAGVDRGISFDGYSDNFSLAPPGVVGQGMPRNDKRADDHPRKSIFACNGLKLPYFAAIRGLMSFGRFRRVNLEGSAAA